MRVRTRLGAIALATAVLSTATGVARDVSSTATPVEHQSVGLVLSGGGAKGIAHAGVIQALEDAGIPIDYVAGTSMGAIVGGLYAAGFTPAEMMALFTGKEFSYWSTGKIEPSMVYYFSRDEDTPAFLHVPLSSSQASDSVYASLISPLPMNMGFVDIFSAYTAQCGGDFDRLFVPFRCVASDVAANHKVVHSSGDLGEAIRTSMSFPIVFQPIKYNGRVLYDGGIYDNFPVGVMTQDFAPDIMIGVDVHTPSDKPQTSILDQIDNLVTRPQSYDMPADRGIRIHINLHEFTLLDFPKAKAIYQAGYDRAMSMIDSIKARVTTRVPAEAVRIARGAFKSKTPYLRFDSVSVTGGTPRQNEYIRYLFEKHPHNRTEADTFGIAHARTAFYRAVSGGRLKDLYPRAIYNDSTDLFTLDLRATPKNDFNLGIGGYITSSTSSYLFLSAGYNTLTFASMGANLNAWIGQSYMGGMLNGTFNLQTKTPSSLGIQAVVGRQRYFETDQLFFEDRMPSFIISHEYYGRLVYTLAAGSRGEASAALGYGHLFDSFYPSNAVVNNSVTRDHDSFNLGQIRLEYKGGTLDNNQYPTVGAAYRFTAMGVLGKMHFDTKDPSERNYTGNPRWVQFESSTRNYFNCGRHFSLGLETDVLLSTRKLTQNYNASIVSAAAFNPTPATHNSFNPRFRANNFGALSLIPIYKYDSSLSARLNLSTFVPLRRIKEGPDGTAFYGKWLSTARFFGELDICYTLPFNATLTAYANYVSAGQRPWNFGLALGIFILPPKFLR